MAIPADIQALLRKLEPEVRRAFEKAFADIKSAAQRRVVVEHIAAGNIEAAITALRLDAAFFSPLDRAIGQAYYEGGLAAVSAINRLRIPFPEAASSSDLTGGTHAQSNGPEISQED